MIEATGVVHGSAIVLDAPVPPLGGRRVSSCWNQPTRRALFSPTKSKIACGVSGSTTGHRATHLTLVCSAAHGDA